MARTLATLPEGSRITDYVSLGVITKTFPLERVRSVLAATGKASIRERDLPAHVVVYYAIALALYMHSSYREVLRCLLEGLQWLRNPALALVQVTGSSGISQARKQRIRVSSNYMRLTRRIGRDPATRPCEPISRLLARR